TFRSQDVPVRRQARLPIPQRFLRCRALNRGTGCRRTAAGSSSEALADVGISDNLGRRFLKNYEFGRAAFFLSFAAAPAKALPLERRRSTLLTLTSHVTV